MCWYSLANVVASRVWPVEPLLKDTSEIRTLANQDTWLSPNLHIEYILFSPWNKDTSLTRTSIVVLRVSVLENFHCSLASQIHFCNKREGSGELCIQAISAVLYSVVQSCCTSLAHDTLQRFSCITVWTIMMTKTQNIFFTSGGAIKHVDYTSKGVCTLCNRDLRVWYVKTIRHPRVHKSGRLE